MPKSESTVTKNLNQSHILMNDEKHDNDDDTFGYWYKEILSES